MSIHSQSGSGGSRSHRLVAAARRRRPHSGLAKRSLLLEQLEQRTVLSADGLETSANSQLPDEGPQYDPSSILVRFQPGAAAANNPAGIVPGTSNGRAFSSVPGLRLVKLGSGVGVEHALRAFQRNPNVLYAEPNYRVHLQQTPNDSSFSSLYGLHNVGQTGGVADSDIDAPEAWDITTGDGSVVVGVIDTGVDYTHPDLAANMWTNPKEVPGDGIDNDINGYTDDVHGYNFVSYNGNSIDDHFHGTHVAGTIGAVGNNGEGVVGVNWNVKIMSLKFLDAYGGGWTADAIAAVDYATMMRSRWVTSGGTEGANIRLTSNSWGGGPSEAALLDAINAGGAAGVLFVAAAGNSGLNADSNPMYPAAYDTDNIISVAATDASDNIAYFSNWGLNSVDLGAPGVNTYSTFPTYLTDEMYYNGFNTHYESISGTSMATPHVSGVAALAWSLNPSASVATIRNAILGSVDPIPSLATGGSRPVATGGRLNARGTLEAMGMAVAGSTPASGSIISTQPKDFVVHFSHPYNAGTVDVDGRDLTVNGVTATSRTLTDLDTVTFHFGTSPVTTQGLQTMHIAKSAIAAAAGAGLPDPLMHEWNASFRLDTLKLAVSSTNPPPTSGVFVLPAPFTYDVTFNEAIDPTTAGDSYLSLSSGWATFLGVSPDNKTVHYQINDVTDPGTLSVFLAAGAVTDTFGNPGSAFSADYTVIPGLTVDSSTPSDGSIVATRPSSYIVNFSDPVLPGSVSASDFTVTSDGISHPATGVTLSGGNTVATFTFSTQPVTIEGAQHMAIAEGAIARASDNDGLAAFSSTFRWDTLTLAVSSTNRDPSGSLISLTGPVAYDVTFNEPVAADSVDLFDLTLSHGTVSSAVRDADNPALVHYVIGGLTSEGILTVGIAEGAVTDLYANPGFADFSANYALDFDTINFPTPLSARLPLGSLIYEQTASGIIGSGSDTDSFKINVAAGQTVTVLVTPSAGLQPTVTLGTTTYTAPAAGKKAHFPAIAGSGPQTITVGAAGGTTGSYSVRVLLNAALETESNDGSANNTNLTAQDINASFITVATSTISADRGAVIGQTDGFAYTAASIATTFENISSTGTKVLAGADDSTVNVSLPFAFPFYNSSYSGLSFSSNGLITFGGADSSFANSNLTTTPTLATIAPFWDDLIVKGAGKSAAVYHQVLGTGASQRLVIQWNSISYDADQAARGGAKGGLTFQAVLFADGSIRFNYQSLATGKNGGANDLGKSATVGIKDAGPQGPDRLLLLLNGSTPSLVGSNKSVQITRGSANPDLYSFSLTAGDTATVAVKVVSAGTVNVDLLNPAGTVVASAVAGPTNLDKVISNFAVTTSGTYQARVTGNGIIQYNLLATRNAALDAELNDTYDTAQDISGRHGVIGHVAAGSSLFHLTGTPVTGGLVLAGSKLTLGINPDGSFISGGTGIQFLGNEFVVPGSPVAGFTIGQAGANYTNKAAQGTTDIGVTLEDLSLGTLRGVRIVGTVGGSLLMERVIVFRQDDEFATIATRLTNTSGATIDNVAWLENLDPDQGEPLGVDFVTFNDVVLGGAFVRADAQPLDYPGGLTIGLGSADTRRVVSAEGFDNRDPYEIITSPVDPNGSSDDIGINLAFDFGSLGAGQAAAGTMIMTFGRTTAEAEATYSSHTAGTLVADDDWYKMTVGADGILHVETSTPGSGPGEPGNTLNPHIEVFGTSPTVPEYVGTPLGDGRNEVVHKTGLNPGDIYRIRVTGEAGTRGEYFLDPPVPTAPVPPAPALAATSSLSRRAAPTGKPATASLLASAALSQKRTASLRPLEVQSVDALFASTNRAGSTSDWYKPQPQAEVADSLLDLVASSLSPGKKGNARSRR